MRVYDQNIWGGFPREYSLGNRMEMIYALIQENAPEVCCFQECTPWTVRSASPSLVSMLKPVYIEAIEEIADKNFTPVFYNTEKLILRDKGYHLYSGTNDCDSKSITWALLEEKETGKTFICMSTHFWWQWTGEQDDFQRKENAKELGDLCRELYKKYNVPIVVAGDLNCGKGCPQGIVGYRAVCDQGLTDARKASSITTEAGTWHGYPTRTEEDTYINGPLPQGSSMDHVFFFGEGLIPKTFSVLLEEKALNSSDHCPLLFDFDLL